MREKKSWEQYEDRMMELLRTQAMPLEEMGKELGLNPDETADLLRHMKKTGRVHMLDILEMN